MAARPRSTLLALACVAAFVWPSAADAARPATDQELADMADAAEFDPVCMTAEVSTVDDAWGTLALCRWPARTSARSS
jgi:hypothetical protein